MSNEFLIIGHVLCAIFLVMVASRTGKTALGGISFLFLVISNLFITKEIHVFNVTITTCDVYTIGYILCLNLLTEIYGKKTARKCLYMGISFLVAFLVMAQFQVAYHPTEHSTEFSNAFSLILKNSPRIIISSLVVTVLSDRLDIYWFQFLKSKFPSWKFSYRFALSTVVSQFLDTLLFSFLALYGIVENIWDCILVAYAVKVCFILGSGLLFSGVSPKLYIPSLQRLVDKSECEG